MKKIVLKENQVNIIKETPEERKERVNSNYFTSTRTRIIQSKKIYNRKKNKEIPEND